MRHEGFKRYQCSTILGTQHLDVLLGTARNCTRNNGSAADHANVVLYTLRSLTFGFQLCVQIPDMFVLPPAYGLRRPLYIWALSVEMTDFSFSPSSRVSSSTTPTLSGSFSGQSLTQCPGFLQPWHTSCTFLVGCLGLVFKARGGGSYRWSAGLALIVEPSRWIRPCYHQARVLLG